MYKNNYILEAAIKDTAVIATLNGESNLDVIMDMSRQTVEGLHLQNNLSRDRVRVLVLEGIAEGMRN